MATARWQRRESEVCTETHHPHAAEQWPAALTCPGCTTTHIGGPWLITQQTLTSGRASVVEKHSTAQLLWEPSIFPTSRAFTLFSGAQMKPQTKEWTWYKWQSIRPQSDNIKTPKEILQNVPLPQFDYTGEKHLKGVCQLQVSFAQARPKGHYKSESDSSNGAWGYI